MTKKITLITIIVLFFIIGNFSLAQKMGETKGIEDIIEKMPQTEFLQPKDGNELKGEVKIEIKVKDAISVEFYLRRPESLTEIYLGKAVPSEKDDWEFNWDTTKTPNGSYYLFPKITNQYGEYSGSGIINQVNNEIEKRKPEEEMIREQVQQTEQIEKNQNQETQTVTEKITEESQNLTREGMQHLKEKEKEVVEEKVNQELKESSKLIEENIKKLTEKVKEEVNASPEEAPKIKKEKEEIKKEIGERVLIPMKPIEEKVEKEVRPEISEQKERIKEKTESQLEKLETAIKESEKVKTDILKELSKDSDNDGLPNSEEIRLGTDPFNPDTDRDGYLDGIEYNTGYDPTKPGPADKIIYQDPQKVKPKKADIYKVERVETLILPTGEIGLKFEGKGLPNSFITLYIFSRPIVVAVKTDGNGHWEYVLDKVISDGQHTVYAAVTNNRGEIEARSEPFVFTKIGEKAFRIFEAPSPTVTSPAEVLQRGFAILVAGIIVFGIGLALIIVGILTRKKREI